MPPKSAPKAKAAVAAPKYQDMITDAIINLKDRNGSSRIALKKYVKANNKSVATNPATFDSLFNRAIQAGVKKGVFAQPKGPSGGTKLAKKEPKPAAAKPKTVAKTEKKPVVKPVVKKAAPAKKPAVKTKAAPKASSAAAPKKAAKPAAKKAAPKAAPKAKAAKTKSAPAIVEKPTVLGKTKSGRVTKTTAKPVAKKPVAKKTAAKKATPKKA